MKKVSKIPFCKMHALGNDFIIIDGIKNIINIKNFPIKKYANRHTGIGFDQLLYLTASEKADVSCQIFNSDGTEAKQCGNGMRCVARYLDENGYVPLNKKNFYIETSAGIIQATINKTNHHDSSITIEMTPPDLTPGSIALSLEKNQQPLNLFALSVGNPHAILWVDSLENFPIITLGKKIAAHSFFPDGINIGFAEIKNTQSVRLETYERGAGKTFSCGSNTCAMVAAGITLNKLISPVNVIVAFGNLLVEWDGPGTCIRLTGPAETVFTGELFL